MRFWIGVASQDHVARGVAGGFCQLCHGKAGPLERMSVGDWIVYYSSKMSFEGPDKCQQFTAIGRVIGRKSYPVQTSSGFKPFRRNVQFAPSHPANIHPLIPHFEFIKDKSRWGYVFRFGFFEISHGDFELISNAMQVSHQVAQPQLSLIYR